ncbi:MAG: thiamine pyrophosphate-requiring protein [SAR202 cluster bacterium]|jgi:acetolactate synthase-1/2/3 large subunit|nr:thiamine pyrophosphate-requiring protein [SAR202 cluster bacterium]MDP6300644.1 thiamine pyrophosphate-requiring protein [SAR202 cluster bacterium]MDP7102342.1 thiamine pyrophosphate-requiring protein [SAR202 cluster bacterium]MDP7225463.1 thiamine pyrophosphate-requiring protein [SAR202 cluster bacterium]MDP7414136.1 thiamine pyrophosphate-requiring protein [SAR202 cluster bacterium]|tara:strand:+ start:18767 stop:20410 length:1644 start_codon:yes stop_codon:yes gene_type:complete
MKTLDAIARVLAAEGVEHLNAYPSTSLIESAAALGIRPIICRQERVGVGIADGYTRVTNGRPPGAFAMQYGPGAENAFAGVATAFSDAVPMLLLPMGHPRERAGVFPHFNSVRSFGAITKSVEQIQTAESAVDTMRRAFARLKMGRPGPVMVEIPTDVAGQEVSDSVVEAYRPVKTTVAGANPQAVAEAAEALMKAKAPVIYAGQGALYGEATDELVQLAELLQIPVVTSMAGKSAFPETHPLALGSATGVMNRAAYHFLRDADLVFALGSSLTKHSMTTPIPEDKVFIQAADDSIDIGKNYDIDYPLIGDARLIVRQFIEACNDIGVSGRDGSTAEKIAALRQQWLAEWNAKLTSAETPITPYRVINEFMNLVDPNDAIVTHDSGSPRDQLMPFYRSGGPRTYLGWGKSHGLGTGLGLNIGAKLAAPDKFTVNFMGDAAFGMVGLDFETAARNNIPILTVVFNNSTMAITAGAMATSHELYSTRDIGGNYADMAQAMGGWSEKVENPSDVAAAIRRARSATENGQASLLEFITSEESDFSHRAPFS